MKAIAYVRVSTDQQADRGVSLEAQTEKVRAMAVVKEAELLGRAWRGCSRSSRAGPWTWSSSRSSIG
jgi:DNA invertase Pin-like site-specific DNA recombinase